MQFHGDEATVSCRRGLTDAGDQLGGTGKPKHIVERCLSLPLGLLERIEPSSSTVKDRSGRVGDGQALCGVVRAELVEQGLEVRFGVGGEGSGWVHLD